MRIQHALVFRLGGREGRVPETEDWHQPRLQGPPHQEKQTGRLSLWLFSGNFWILVLIINIIDIILHHWIFSDCDKWVSSAMFGPGGTRLPSIPAVRLLQHKKPHCPGCFVPLLSFSPNFSQCSQWDLQQHQTFYREVGSLKRWRSLTTIHRISL